MSRASIALLALCVGLAGVGGGFFYGKHLGGIEEAGKRDAQALDGVTKLLDSHKALVSDAGKASRAMRQAIGERATQDAQTTQEFKDALSRTAASRDGCVFPADVMRGIAAARERAAEAAALGIRGGVSGASGEPARER